MKERLNENCKGCKYDVDSGSGYFCFCCVLMGKYVPHFEKKKEDEMATEKTQEQKYSYRTIWSQEDNQFIGLCDEFPSLSWLAYTEEEALKGIIKLVEK